MDNSKVTAINGSIVTAEKMNNIAVLDSVRVGEKGLLGEVTELSEASATIKVFEKTDGLKSGENVQCLNAPLTSELGPGLLGSAFDSLGRPLKELGQPTLSRRKEWIFEPTVKEGDRVFGGDVMGTVKENESVNHRVMLPLNLGGIVKEISSGTCTAEDIVAIVLDEKGNENAVGIFEKWPIRKRRPNAEKFCSSEVLLTGIRGIDSFYTIAKGGTAVISGSFGSGKTMLLKKIAEGADADVIVFVFCGGRLKETSELINEFNMVKDRKTGRPLKEKSVFISGSSELSVAADELSADMGFSVSEYFRAMGYNVLLLVDSLSSWAGAISVEAAENREVLTEDGYPAYFNEKLFSLLERAGKTISVGKDSREGTLTLIATASTFNGFDEAVIKESKRSAKTFISLSDSKINFNESFSRYSETLAFSDEFLELREKALKLLNNEKELSVLLDLMGEENLSEDELKKYELIKNLRKEFLTLDNYEYSSENEQFELLKSIIETEEKGDED